MDKKERLMAVLNGTMPDRPPVGALVPLTDAESRGRRVCKPMSNLQTEQCGFCEDYVGRAALSVRQKIDCAADWQSLPRCPGRRIFADTLGAARIHEEWGRGVLPFYNFSRPLP